MEGDSTLRFTAFVCFTLLFLTPFTEVAGQKQAYKKSSRGYGYIQELDRDRGSTTCDNNSCYPRQGNLLIGREDRLSATSTCGLKRLERYCIVSHLKEKKKCFYCNSSDKRQNDKFDHGIGKIVSRISKRKGGTWWQSENGVEEVSIRLDLEAAFHLTHVIIKFKTFRPAAMLIERSSDYGLTWKIYQYFAYSCEDSFPGVPVRARQRVDDVVCDTQYSGVEPSSDGEVIFKAVPPHIHLDNPYSEEALDILSITNLRINFTKLHTFGDNLLDSREEIKEKYYFAIKEMYVRGSCFCNGHASHCVVDPELNQISKLEMVYGKCECNHNTEGKNCNKCKALYNDHPWRPAILKETNECKLCECNNHATECEFNKTLWENSGRVSGGVCTNCKHHTTGRNCDQCQSFYYQDPGRDIRDPNICQQCDCDSRGSLYDGICDPKTDLDRSTTAGNCHCKRNVDGRRCDRCKNGYWKFEENNPEGCIACTCDPMGTVENHGCNAYTGECLCKRNVIGKDCNQCLPEFWGLSTDEEGCKPCDCDPGGSYDNNCDVITGRCRCRPNINGRKCDQPENGFFAGDLDYMVYEAELARGSPDCQVLVREPYPNRDSTWTGLGFMRVFENSYLEFDVTDVPVSMEYDVVIRYEPQLSGQWEEVTVTIERPGPIDPDGPCANTIPQDDKKRVTLPSGERYIVVFPPACLEEGKNYKIRIEFKQYDNQIDTPTASILIDSIALIPRIDSIPFFQGTPQNEHRRQEYERFRCGQAFYSVVRPAPPDVCKKYLYSIGFYVYGQAHECYCDPTGSVSTACDTLGGQCTCKPNVVGKRCDRCAPGTYGFGPTGCKPCDCNSVGSLDNFCGGQSQTGQCKCRPNTYGRQCDECQPGYWNYPNCQRCDCNGHADTCDSRTGFCIDCRDFTSGHKCDRCENGFYGDPRIGKDIACRPCPCPGTVESGISHASTCELDPRTQNVICLCDQGYAGERCDRCAQNYFGDPTVPGGECKKCDCNNNVDETVAGNCDARTGECLKCLYNTEGFYCENCRDGYYGDATRQQCLECVCNLLGTNPNGGYCEKRTGQCPCLPSVVGQSCDRCEDNHWKIASGEGCEACNCDQLGSYSPTCNEYYGQCSCRAGHGGLQCNECEANFWGNPAIQCNPCNCNLNGSTTQQCHRNNGTCVCKPGIAGDRCDQCARGYTGRAPYCDPCGECFDNWDLIIQNLKDKTLELLDAASRIKQTGVTGVFTQTFTEMEEKLREVKEILDITNITSEDIDTLQRRIDEIRDQLKKTEARLTGVEDEVENTTQRITDANLTLANLRKDADALAKAAEDLKEKATTLQEDNVEGALNITRDAQKRSRAADDRVNEYSQAKEDLNNSLRLRRRTEAMLNASSGAYDKTLKANEDALNRISDEINDFTDQIPDINKQVCDGRGRVDSCDLSCGGAGCGMCGGLGCGEGAVRKAQNAEEIAKETEEKLAEKEKKATELLNKLSGVKTAAETALEEAKAAFERAKQAKNRSEDASGDIEKLIESIEAFLKAEGGKPSEIRTLAEECLDLKISLKPEEIMELARRINDTIAGLKNIDGILRDTEANLDMANKLKIRADNAKEDADDILKTAEDVLEALKEAKKAQEGAQKAIDDAKRDTKTAEEILEEIADETETAQALSNRTLDDVGGLKDRLTALKKKFVENQKDAEKAGTQSEIAERLSDRAAVLDFDAQELERKYQEALNNLNKKAGASGKSKDRAERLRERAKKLAEDANGKLNELTGMEDAFHENEQKLKDYSEILERLNREMTEHLAVIDDRSSFYRDCQS